MNRKNCQNCFFFGVNDKTCNYLLSTGQPRGCIPTDHYCEKKLTHLQAADRGIKKPGDALRTWMPEDEFKLVQNERRKIYEQGNLIKEMVWQGVRYQR